MVTAGGGIFGEEEVEEVEPIDGPRTVWGQEVFQCRDYTAGLLNPAIKSLDYALQKQNRKTLQKILINTLKA